MKVYIYIEFVHTGTVVDIAHFDEVRCPQRQINFRPDCHSGPVCSVTLTSSWRSGAALRRAQLVDARYVTMFMCPGSSSAGLISRSTDLSSLYPTTLVTRYNTLLLAVHAIYQQTQTTLQSTREVIAGRARPAGMPRHCFVTIAT